MAEVIFNFLALIGSFISMILLGMIIPKIGGSIGLLLKMLIVGVFFSVFIHAAIELAAIYNLLPGQVLMPTMGVLLSVGSLFFILAGIIGINSLK